jgi:predicted Zn-dependent peptidase
MILPLVLAVAIAAGDTVDSVVPAAQSAVRPASVVVHTQPAIPIVALRMSLLVDDPEGYAGAGHLFQRLTLARLRDQVSRVGGRVQMQRNSDAVVYTVVGPAAELDYLATVLRSALTPPAPSEGEMVVAHRAMEEARLSEWETAANHVRARLRASLFPSDLPAAGTPSSAARLEASAIRSVWAEMYDPDRVSVVAVGDVRMERVREAFAELPARPRDRLSRTFADTVARPGLAPAEATRGWLGHGYDAGGLDAAAVNVAAHLLGDHLRARLPTSEVAAEHWWTHHGQAVALVVAAPETGLAAARRAIGTAVTTVAEGLDDVTVRDAATRIRRELLFHSRTPDRMAELVGGFVDRTGDPDALQRFFDALDRVGPRDVERVLERLATRTPARVDVPPQVLPSS